MKKRLLAALLSLTMLTAQVLPVVAVDDADVTVSENFSAEEETEEAVDETVEETGLYDIELEEMLMMRKRESIFTTLPHLMMM